MDGISVIVPCFNAARYLPACLDSILSQRVEGPLEVLVGDDGSTDDSAAVASRYGDPVRLLRHPGGINRGLAATRNLCLAQARYDRIAFLDADDVWLPGHLDALSRALKAHPEAGLVYTNGAYLMPSGAVVGSRLPDDHRTVTAEDVLMDCQLLVHAVMLRREVLDVVGGFDETLHWGGEDQDLWLRILEAYPAVYVPQSSCLYRMHEQQRTRSPQLWRSAALVVERALARHAYRREVVSRRKAVLAYRLGQAAWAQGQVLQAAWHGARAGWLDPSRAVRTVLDGLLAAARKRVRGRP